MIDLSQYKVQGISKTRLQRMVVSTMRHHRKGNGYTIQSVAWDNLQDYRDDVDIELTTNGAYENWASTKTQMTEGQVIDLWCLPSVRLNTGFPDEAEWITMWLVEDPNNPGQVVTLTASQGGLETTGENQ